MDIIKIIEMILMIIIFAISLYLRKSSKLRDVVVNVTKKTISILHQNDKFCEADSLEKEKRINEVVMMLKDIVPKDFKLVVNDNVLYNLVKETYDELEEEICNKKMKD